MNFDIQIDSALTPPIHFPLLQNISLRDKNWFQTGGDAKFYTEPTTPEQFKHALEWARINGHEIFVLGAGANILISDDGFDGIVIRPQLNSLEVVFEDHDHAWIKAGAGVQFCDLIQYCLGNNLGGLHEFSGIPGTVGGSVFINIHYFEFLLDAFLTHATVIDRKTSLVTSVENPWFNFGYNYSTLHNHEYYVVDATFKVKKISQLEAAYARGRSEEMIRYRSRRYPTSRTCGSFFRNFFEHEVSLESNNKKMVYVAYYLDKLGFKGQLAVGDALVSHLHANMIVNKNKATSHDIISLAQIMQDKVKSTFGLLPQPECRLIGFKEHPLRNHAQQ